MQRYFKYILYRLGLMRWTHAILFRFSQVQNRTRNRAFLRQHPGTIIPPDHFLFETYSTDYRKYMEDGRLAAKEIEAWCAPYLPLPPEHILDWGCGTARITRHLACFFPESSIHGCDTDEGMINWDRRHIMGVEFSLTPHKPPLPYRDAQFGLITAFSVLTHIAATDQQAWLNELHRILRPGGILILSTHGSAYEHQLVTAEKKRLRSDGVYSRPYPVPGHRILSTYHDAEQFRPILETRFIVLEAHEGAHDPSRIGAQDLWILRARQQNTGYPILTS